jgi:Fe-Mn family superoxide dismutase
LLKKNEKAKPEGQLKDLIDQTFGSFDAFQKEFTEKATKLFGSGWTWLVKDTSNALSIVTTPNQDSPISEGLSPVIGLDVWEHAYYLKYQNKRPEYIAAFWNIINWDQAEKNYNK